MDTAATPHLIERVAKDLKWHMRTVREENLQIIHHILDQNPDQTTWNEYFNGDAGCAPRDVLEDFDDVCERHHLAGVIPPKPNFEPSMEDIDRGAEELLEEVKEHARHGAPDGLRLPTEFLILCAMAESVRGPGLPKHRAVTESITLSFERIDGQELDGATDVILDIPETDDDDGEVEILAGWICGDEDSAGFYPWALWCRVVNDGQTIKAWAWRYTIASTESAGRLCHSLREFMQQLIDLNPEGIE